MRHETYCQNIKSVKYPNYCIMSLYVLSYWGAGTEYIIFKFTQSAKPEKMLFKWICHSDKLPIKRVQNLVKSIRKIYIYNTYRNMWKEFFSKYVSAVFYLQSLFETYRKTHANVGSIALHWKYLLKSFQIINCNIINLMLVLIK